MLIEAAHGKPAQEMFYPLTFQPIFKERVWGGRRIGELFHKPLPPKVPIGESWEITDRPEGTSVVSNGSLAGKDLRWLMENHAWELLGDFRPAGGRFPILAKILDARERLSLQVHPPPGKARESNGEPKTELWYVAEAEPGAQIFTGLNRGVRREDFERKIKDGSVAECFFRHTIERGDVMFLPSGRVHALGAGSVIFEIQQNSDTTYRVFDWNRVGLDGKPRELHIPQALASINWNDFEPPLSSPEFDEHRAFKRRQLVEHELFSVDEIHLGPGVRIGSRREEMMIICVVEGQVFVRAADCDEMALIAGQFCLVPACLRKPEIWTVSSAKALLVKPGRG
jgi:mannose-6-phosphate isomerase